MKSEQTCPKCGSKNIRVAETLPMQDPLLKEGLFGWECLDCGYTGKDFFIHAKKK